MLIFSLYILDSIEKWHAPWPFAHMYIQYMDLWLKIIIVYHRSNWFSTAMKRVNNCIASFRIYDNLNLRKRNHKKQQITEKKTQKFSTPTWTIFHINYCQNAVSKFSFLDNLCDLTQWKIFSNCKMKNRPKFYYCK